MPKPGRLVTMREAAIELGVKYWRLQSWVASGQIPAVRPPDTRTVFIDRRDLEKVIEGWKR